MNTGRGTIGFLIMLLVLISLAIGAAYYRYLYRGDVRFYISEDDFPERFELGTYSEL